MKVVHINTSVTGGAAKAALRLHRAILDLGIDSSFLCADKPHDFTDQTVFSCQRTYPTWKESILHKLGLLTYKHEKNDETMQKAQGDFDAFTFPYSDYDLAKHPLVLNCDIIHLHWIANFIDFPNFFPKINKPIVWTLHDKNPAMGGFHLLADTTRTNNLKETESNLTSIKYETLRNSRISVVSPSTELLNFSKQSKQLSQFSHVQIFNCVNFEVFLDLSNFQVKNILGIPDNKTNLLVLSSSLTVFHKGFDLLWDAVKKLDSNKFHLTVVGSYNKSNAAGFSCTELPFISDEFLLSIVYSASDALIIPSREENLPNVMIESLACGTPVVAFGIGGMKDVIQSGFNGLLANEVSANSLAEVLTEFANKQNIFNREAIRQHAMDNFSPEIIAKQYIELYNSILK